MDIDGATAFMMKISADLNTVLWERMVPSFFELRRVTKAKDGQSYAAAGNIAPEDCRRSSWDVLHQWAWQWKQCAGRNL